MTPSDETESGLGETPGTGRGGLYRRPAPCTVMYSTAQYRPGLPGVAASQLDPALVGLSSECHPQYSVHIWVWVRGGHCDDWESVWISETVIKSDSELREFEEWLWRDRERGSGGLGARWLQADPPPLCWAPVSSQRRLRYLVWWPGTGASHQYCDQ